MDKDAEEYEEFTIDFNSEQTKSMASDWLGKSSYESVLNSFTPSWQSTLKQLAALTAASVFFYVVLDLTGRAISKWLD